jgi:hypothetical protein
METNLATMTGITQFEVKLSGRSISPHRAWAWDRLGSSAMC